MTDTAEDFEEALKSASNLLPGDAETALERANSLIAQRPDARAFRLAAATLRALGRPDEAAQAELRGIAFGVAEPLKRARAAQQSGRSSEAKKIAEDYLRSNPGDLLAMTIAAEAAVRLDYAGDAEPMLREVVERAPGFPPANLILANALAAQLRLHEAAEILENFLRRVPQENNARRYLADLRAQMNDPSTAASLYAEVLALQPNNPSDQFKYAQLLRTTGRRAECIEALRRTIALGPLDGNAWWALAHYFPQELTDSDQRQIRAAVETPGVGPTDLGPLQIARSILDHRGGNYEAAFESIMRAKSLLSWGPGYDPLALSRHVDELIAAYTPELFERCKDRASQSAAPIFIVGMPRTGSTLLERILGEHSKIEAIGEIPVIPRLVAAQQPEGAAKYRSLLPDSLSGEKLMEAAEWYLARSKEYRRTEKPYFTDKYNGNWIRAGLIRLLFPNSKILDIRRNPVDCCWAVFKSVLVGDYSNDQRDLARYYADYVRLMDATAAASPDGILTVSYEDLVTDVEGQTRRVLDFLGLDFEEQCVNFHQSTAAVKTASSEQVRRPINSESIGSAEPYRQWLEPLISELDSLLPNQPAA